MLYGETYNTVKTIGEMHIVPVIGTVRNINIDEVAPAFNFHLKSMHPQTDDHWCNINKFTVLEMGIKPLNL